MKTWNLYIFHVFLYQIAEYLSSPIKDVRADRRLLAAILGYRKEDIGFISEVIRVHNKYRKIHGCRDLSQCARLRQQSGMYAQELANQGVREVQNSPKLEFGIGENVYISCGNEVSGEEVVNHWYNEACNYFSGKKSYNEYKHFAQVVWKATYLIGVGRRTSTKSGQKCTYVVTRYRPGAEQGPAESVNIPKGNFDSSICSGNSGGPGTNIQGGFASQTGSRDISKSAANSGQSMPTTGRLISQPESSQPGRMSAGSQPAGYSTPAGSMATETSEGGGAAGNSGITGSNSMPTITPTSVPGTGDLERARNPENSHISPLIEQQETETQGSQGTGGEQVSQTATPHCPPCPDIQTESFETSGDVERLPDSNNNPRSAGNKEQSSTNENPEQLTSSASLGKPVDQTNTANPDKPAEPVNSGQTVEPVNPVDKASPGEQVRPAEQANSAKPDNPVGSSGGGKQCPACSCPKKQKSKSSPGGNEVSQGKPNGKEGQPSEGNNTPTKEVRPSSEGRPGGNVVSPESTGVSGQQTPSENPPERQGEGGREGGTEGGSSEGTGVMAGGSEGKTGTTGISSEGTGSSQGSKSIPDGNEVSQGQPNGKEGQPSEGNNTPTNEVKPSNEGRPGGNVVSPESTGVSGQKTPSENTPARQGEGGQEGGTKGGPSEGTGATEGSETGSGGVGNTGDKGMGGVEGGQTEATQGAGGQGGGVSGSIPEGGAFVENLQVFQQSALKAHNKYRQFHNSPPLLHNSEMSAQATGFAQKLAKSNINDIEHSLKSARENQGENVYAGCLTNPSGADVTKEWYKELCNYDYNKQTKIDTKKPIGHFTQVIWKSSTEFGIGRAYGSDQNCVYIVARYKPAGNILGSESSNVLRGTMDDEYCGREFAALNKPENGKKEESSPGGQPNGANKVETEQTNQNTNEASKQESTNANEGTEQNTNQANPSEENNVSQGTQQNGQNSNTGESNQSETSTSEGNQQNTNTGDTSTTSNEGGRQQTEGRNEQAGTGSSSQGDGNNRIKTPFLPGYLQKTALENTNKRYKGFKTE